MSKYSLIPGMEAFMEDTSVEVDVEVGAPEEVVEEQAEAEEVVAEGAEEVAEAESDAEQAEMIFQQFDRVETYLNHAKKYGVDRTFLSLLNSDGSLSQAIGYSLPACESFDVTGSPMSAESQAVIAGLEGVMGDIWTFIKNVAAKIKAFFAKIWNWITARFGDIDKRIGRLRARLKDLKKKTDIPDGEVISPVDLKSALDKIKAGQFAQKIQTEINKVKTGVGGVQNMDFSKYTSAASGGDWEKFGGKDGEFSKDKIKDFKKSIKDIKSSPKKEGYAAAVTKLEDYLNTASQCRKEVIQYQNVKKMSDTASDLIAKTVDKLAAHNQEDKKTAGAAKELRKMTSRLSECQSVMGSVMDGYNWIATTAVKSVATVMSKAMEPEKA